MSTDTGAIGTSESTLFALFGGTVEAERAINQLSQAGFEPEELGYLAPGDPQEPEVAKGMTAASGTGATAGALAGGLLGAAVVGLIPGIGPVLAGGTLLVAMGAVTGAGTGATLGLLVGSSIAEDQARYYTDAVACGRTLVSVTTSRTDVARYALELAGALEVADVGSSRAPRVITDE